MRVITLLSNCGGIGKTTVAINLSRAMADFALSPIRVLDLDPNRSLMRASGFAEDWWLSGPPSWGAGYAITVCTLEENELSRGRVRPVSPKRAFLKVALGHHITIVDTPPGLHSLTWLALSKTDIAVLIVDPEENVAENMARLASQLARFKNPPLIHVIGVRREGLCKWRRELSSYNGYTHHCRVHILMIPESRDLPSSFRAGVSILDYAPGSTAALNFGCQAMLLEYDVRKAKVERFLRTVTNS